MHAHIEQDFNTVWPSAIVFQQPAGALGALEGATDDFELQGCLSTEVEHDEKMGVWIRRSKIAP